MTHFLTWGAADGRDPNRWFDSRWYAQRYPDLAGSGAPPLLHYMLAGAAELRNPHPRFDAAWYAEQHPEAAANPLLHHMLVGEARGWRTEPPIDIADYLPATAAPFVCPSGVRVDVVVPVYRGLAETRRCLESVLADPDRPAGRRDRGGRLLAGGCAVRLARHAGGGRPHHSAAQSAQPRVRRLGRIAASRPPASMTWRC